MALPIPTNHVQRLGEIDEIERKLAIEKALTLDRALRSGNVEQIYKAEQYWKLSQLRDRTGANLGWPYQAQQTPDNPLKALMIDPLQTTASQGFYNKRGVISFENLRTVGRVPIPSAIIKTRKNQVANFLKPQPDPHSPGFVLEMTGVDDEDELTDADKRERDELIEFLLKCGDKSAEYKWDNFETFGRKVIDDSLTLDQANFEVVPYRDGTPYCFAAVDAATMRIAASYDNQTNVEELEKVRGEYPSYVQLYQGRPARLFYPWEMSWGIRNPQTSIYHNNYGRAEAEDLVTTVTALVNADRYNGGFFRHGSAPKGMLMVKKPGAALDGDRLAEFRRSWNAMISGVGNAHKLPILDAESFEYIDFSKNNRDMEFSKFQEWLLKLCCAQWTISPEEIGFPLEGAGKGGGLNSGDGKEEKDYSKDKGLHPLLTHLQTWINHYLMQPKTKSDKYPNGKWRFKFVGIKQESAKEESERLQKEVTTITPPDEIRKQQGKKPLPDGVGRYPLNPIIAQMIMMKNQNQQDAKQQQYEQGQQQQEDDQEQQGNTNPFLEDESNPFVKSFEEFMVTNLVKE